MARQGMSIKEETRKRIIERHKRGFTAVSLSNAFSALRTTIIGIIKVFEREGREKAKKRGGPSNKKLMLP